MQRLSRKGCVRELKERLDVLLVNKGFFSSRERAKTAIMAGDVYVNGGISDKAGTKIDEEAEITVKNDQCPYVGRGGYKLAKAIGTFGLAAKTAMDIGASTGGFTDCMLQNGASKVYSVDVGYGQLDWKLRNDPRVVNMEKVNVRYLEPDTIPDRMDFVSIDVSFISLKLIFPVVVRDRDVHRQVIENVIIYAVSNGLKPEELTFSPMTGAKGNIEYLLRAVNVPEGSFCDSEISKETIGSVIDEAHLALQK